MNRLFSRNVQLCKKWNQAPTGGAHVDVRKASPFVMVRTKALGWDRGKRKLLKQKRSPGAPANIRERCHFVTGHIRTFEAWHTPCLISRAMNYDNATEQEERFSMPKGVLGAFLGAAIGIGLMWGFYALVGMRFPLLGVGIGVLTGYGARVLYKGTDSTLGFISAGIALVSVVATLFLMYGEFPILSIISVIVSASLAHRIASTSATI
jgi:hypothetical protein